MAAPEVRIVVCGPAGVGKSSLITAVATDAFPERAPPVLPPTRLPASAMPDNVAALIVDTSARLEERAALEQECARADAIVLAYAASRPASLAALRSEWLPMLRGFGCHVPIVLAGCKCDLRQDAAAQPDSTLLMLMNDFREVETHLDCSAKKHVSVREVFYYAQKTVLHPTAPLFDLQAQALKPACYRALKRIFLLCDRDGDGVLNDEELNRFQVVCFQAPLQPKELAGIKEVVKEKLPTGVSAKGLTLTGFMFLHALFIERGRMETTWTVLRKFGYTNELRLSSEMLGNGPPPAGPDQSVELTESAINFLETLFTAFDKAKKGALGAQELNDLFSTAPNTPWNESMWQQSAQTNSVGELTLEGFLAMWAWFTYTSPRIALENLLYLGYGEDPARAMKVSKTRKQERQRGLHTRKVLQGYVFGADQAGKSAMLDGLVGTTSLARPRENMAVGPVADDDGDVTLILKEVEVSRVPMVLGSPEEMAGCDVAVFVFDSSSRESLRSVAALLEQVVERAQSFPCVLVAAKDDLGMSTELIGECSDICAQYSIPLPLPLSVKSGDTASLYAQVVSFARQPDLAIPETDVQKTAKRNRRLLYRSLAYAAAGTAAVATVACAYRWYRRSKETASASS